MDRSTRIQMSPSADRSLASEPRIHHEVPVPDPVKSAIESYEDDGDEDPDDAYEEDAGAPRKNGTEVAVSPPKPAVEVGGEVDKASIKAAEAAVKSRQASLAVVYQQLATRFARALRTRVSEVLLEMDRSKARGEDSAILVDLYQTATAAANPREPVARLQHEHGYKLALIRNTAKGTAGAVWSNFERQKQDLRRRLLLERTRKIHRLKREFERGPGCRATDLHVMDWISNNLDVARDPNASLKGMDSRDITADMQALKRRKKAVDAAAEAPDTAMDALASAAGDGEAMGTPASNTINAPVQIFFQPPISMEQLDGHWQDQATHGALSQAQGPVVSPKPDKLQRVEESPVHEQPQVTTMGATKSSHQQIQQQHEQQRHQQQQEQQQQQQQQQQYQQQQHEQQRQHQQHQHQQHQHQQQQHQQQQQQQQPQPRQPQQHPHQQHQPQQQQPQDMAFQALHGFPPHLMTQLPGFQGAPPMYQPMFQGQFPPQPFYGTYAMAQPPQEGPGGSVKDDKAANTAPAQPQPQMYPYAMYGQQMAVPWGYEAMMSQMYPQFMPMPQYMYEMPRQAN